MSLRNILKGWLGEFMGASAHRFYLDKNIYFPIENVTLAASGGTTQIDHILVSKFGIFIVEAKNIDGWIFGDERAANWTVSKFGKKFQIQNPLRQNFRHTKAISDFLSMDSEKIHSIVMFWGKCEFKTPMPKNVIREGYTSYIKSFQSVLFSDADVLAIVAALKAGMLPKTWATRRAHLESLHSRHSSTTVCPNCGQSLILRTAKSGTYAGTSFYGCSTYPKCRYTTPTTS